MTEWLLATVVRPERGVTPTGMKFPDVVAAGVFSSRPVSQLASMFHGRQRAQTLKSLRTLT